MDLGLDWGALLSTAGGSSIAIAVFKAFLTKALRDLEEVTKKVNDTLLQLSAITIKMNELEKIKEQVHSHERMLSKIEAKIEHGRQKRVFKNDPNRM